MTYEKGMNNSDYIIYLDLFLVKQSFSQNNNIPKFTFRYIKKSLKLMPMLSFTTNN